MQVLESTGKTDGDGNRKEHGLIRYCRALEIFMRIKAFTVWTFSLGVILVTVIVPVSAYGLFAV